MKHLILPFALFAALSVSGAVTANPDPRAPAPDAAETDGDDAAPATRAPAPDEDEDEGAAPANALQSGGQSGGQSGVAPRRSPLQEALLACEGLSGSASARCQEQALADHPGEF